MSIESLKSDGMTDEEIRLLTKPIADMTVAEWPHAMAAKDRHSELNRKANMSFVPQQRSGAPGYISDTLDLVLNPATGKHYDSKHKYYADLKATGHMVQESGMEVKNRETRGDFNCAKELKEAAQKHGFL